MLDQENNFYMISILITCLLDSVWILLGEVTSQSLVGVGGLNKAHQQALIRVWRKSLYAGKYETLRDLQGVYPDLMQSSP